jgi:hypothetical protein
VVFAGAVDGFAVGAGHPAADHGHGAADLEDGAVDVDFGAWFCERARGGVELLGCGEVKGKEGFRCSRGSVIGMTDDGPET